MARKNLCGFGKYKVDRFVQQQRHGIYPNKFRYFSGRREQGLSKNGMFAFNGNRIGLNRDRERRFHNRGRTPSSTVDENLQRPFRIKRHQQRLVFSRERGILVWWTECCTWLTSLKQFNTSSLLIQMAVLNSQPCASIQSVGQRYGIRSTDTLKPVSFLRITLVQLFKRIRGQKTIYGSLEPEKLCRRILQRTTYHFLRFSPFQNTVFIILFTGTLQRLYRKVKRSSLLSKMMNAKNFNIRHLDSAKTHG